MTHAPQVSTGIEFVRPPTLAGAAPCANAVVTAPGRMTAASGDHDAPSTLMGVTVLGHPDQLVEVQAVAVHDGRQEPAPPHDGPTVAP